MTAARPKLDIDTTRERLMALGFTHAAEQLGPLLGEAVREEIAAHLFLDRLLAAELSGREERRVKTSLKVSNLPVGQTLENFDFAFQPAIERSRIDTLATCAWVRDGETVLLQGPPGVGKSHLCVGLGVKAVQLGFEPMTRQEASLFFRLVSYRYGRGAMLITTNKSIRDWTELLAGDEVLATAILDRLLHRAHVLNIKGRSYRLRDLEDALKLAHA